MTEKQVWNGDATLANSVFGETYGVDWEYLPDSSDIKVKDSIIKIGDPI